MLRGFTLARRVLARPGRANNLVCLVEHGLRPCSTKHTKSGERRRREQAIVMESRQTRYRSGDFQLLRRRNAISPPRKTNEKQKSTAHVGPVVLSKRPK